MIGYGLPAPSPSSQYASNPALANDNIMKQFVVVGLPWKILKIFENNEKILPMLSSLCALWLPLLCSNLSYRVVSNALLHTPE